MYESRFQAIWRDIVRWDAVPHDRLPIDSDDVVDCIVDMLIEFAGGCDLLVDSGLLISRPTRFNSAEVPRLVELHRSCLEFVAIRKGDDSSYWAITEEEYEWQIFMHA